MSSFIALVPIIALIINIAFQITVIRFAPGTGLLKSIAFGFVTGLLAVVSITFQAVSSSDSRFLLDILLTSSIAYLALSYCYFHFINLGETGRRVRLMQELYEAKNGLSENQLLDRYNASEIIDKRIERLLATGQIQLKNGSYYAARPIMLYIARAMILFKIILFKKRVADARIN